MFSENMENMTFKLFAQKFKSTYSTCAVFNENIKTVWNKNLHLNSPSVIIGLHRNMYKFVRNVAEKPDVHI